MVFNKKKKNARYFKLSIVQFNKGDGRMGLGVTSMTLNLNNHSTNNIHKWKKKNISVFIHIGNTIKYRSWFVTIFI